MKLTPPVPLKDIAALIGCAFEGNPLFPVSGINEIHKVGRGDLVFVDHPKYYEKALQSAASIVLINQQVACPEGKALIFSDDPFRDYNFLTRHFSPWRMTSESSRENCIVAADAIVHSSVIMGNGCSIGAGTIVHPGVVMYDNVHVGTGCIIHANTVLGSDAFYYKARPTGRDKMHSCGSVEIEDHVEIGAGCTIDRGVSSDTRIGAGTKIDNHVHIGHDTVVGQNCLFAAQVGIAGCVVIEDNVILWGQVGIASDIHIGRGAVVLGQSGITKDLKGDKTYFGTPAEEVRHKYREMALIRKLPEVIEKLGI
jgi:UDP-3-O-[3-hydroxymyristoyl] glucosamine N-acyltransferase